MEGYRRHVDKCAAFTFFSEGVYLIKNKYAMLKMVNDNLPNTTLADAAREVRQIIQNGTNEVVSGYNSQSIEEINSKLKRGSSYVNNTNHEICFIHDLIKIENGKLVRFEYNYTEDYILKNKIIINSTKRRPEKFKTGMPESYFDYTNRNLIKEGVKMPAMLKDFLVIYDKTDSRPFKYAIHMCRLIDSVVYKLWI